MTLDGGDVKYSLLVVPHGQVYCWSSGIDDAKDDCLELVNMLKRVIQLQTNASKLKKPNFYFFPRHVELRVFRHKAFGKFAHAPEQDADYENRVQSRKIRGRKSST